MAACTVSLLRTSSSYAPAGGKPTGIFNGFVALSRIDENQSLDQIVEIFDQNVEYFSFSGSTIWLALSSREARVISVDHNS